MAPLTAIVEHSLGWCKEPPDALPETQAMIKFPEMDLVTNPEVIAAHPLKNEPFLTKKNLNHFVNFTPGRLCGARTISLELGGSIFAVMLPLGSVYCT